MPGRHYLEHALRPLDVLRHIAYPERQLPGEIDWLGTAPDIEAAQTKRLSGATSGWQWAREERDRIFDDRPDNPPPGIDWAINQATGAGAMGPFGRVSATDWDLSKIDAAWFADGLTDPRVPEVEWPGISPYLPSLNRRPGVIYLPPCVYFLDHPILLYPGQELRGAGWRLDADGRPVAGTVLVLRSGRARVVGCRFVDDVPEAHLAHIERFRLTLGPRSRPSSTLYYRVRPNLDGKAGKTSISVRDLAVIDERELPGDTAGKVAVDLGDCWLSRAENLALYRAPEKGGGGAGLRMGRDDQWRDTGAYFNRVERCRFAGFESGVLFIGGGSSQVVKSCGFDVPESGSGIVAGNGYIRLTTNVFRGPPGAVGVRLARGRWPVSPRREDGRSGDLFSHGAARLITGNVFLGPEPMRLEDEGRGPRAPTAELAGNVADGPAPRVAVEPGLAEGSHLARASGQRLVVHGGDAAAPQASSGHGGTNLLGNVCFEGFSPADAARIISSEEEIAERRGRWARLADAVAYEALECPASDPEQPPQSWWFVRRGPEDGGPGDNGDSLDIRTRRPDEGPAGPGLRRPFGVRVSRLGRDTHHRLNIWQPITAPHNQDERSFLLRASRFSGRPLHFAAWVRTNLRPARLREPDFKNEPWVSGVALSLWGRSDDPTTARFPDNTVSGRCGAAQQRRVLAQSNRHSGGSRWELLTGVAYTSTYHWTLVGSTRATLSFSIDMHIDWVALDGKEPFLDICTPYVGTGLHPGAPRAPVFTEDGGRLSRPLEPQRGVMGHLTLSAPGRTTARLPSAARIRAGYAFSPNRRVQPAALTAELGRLIARIAPIAGLGPVTFARVAILEPLLDAGTQLELNTRQELSVTLELETDHTPSY